MAKVLHLQVERCLDDAVPIGELRTVSAAAVIGRAPDAGICIPSTTVSRRHAEVRPTSDGWEVQPLTSSNGTFIDEAPLLARTPLAVGQRLQVGGVVLLVTAGDETRPVLTPLGGETAEPVLSVRWDGDRCTTRCRGRLLALEPQPTKALAALVERPGVTVHRWDILDVIGDGPSVNLDRCMSKVRRCLRDAVQEGLLERTVVMAGIRAHEADPGDLDELAVDALVRRFLASRRGHGYVLCLDEAQVEVVRE